MKSFRLVLATVSLVSLLATGCQSMLKIRPATLEPRLTGGATAFTVDGVEYLQNVASGIKVIVKAESAEVTSFMVWIVNESDTAKHFSTADARLSSRRDGEAFAEIAAMSGEQYVRKTLKCYYKDSKYDSFKAAVDSNYLADSLIGPGKSAAGFLRFDTIGGEVYELRLRVAGTDFRFEYDRRVG